LLWLNIGITITQKLFGCKIEALSGIFFKYSTFDTKIAGKKVMIFSKSYCPYCTKAKQVFKKHLGKDLSEEDYE
jgi:thioredoxin-related protein